MTAQHPPTGHAGPRGRGATPRSRSTTDAARVLVAGIAVSAAIPLVAAMASASRPNPAGTSPALVTPNTGLAPSGLPLAPATGPPVTTSHAS